MGARSIQRCAAKRCDGQRIFLAVHLLQVDVLSFSRAKVKKMSNSIFKPLPLIAFALSALLVGPVLAQDNTNRSVQVGKVNINHTRQCGDTNDNATYQDGKVNINKTKQGGCNDRGNGKGQGGGAKADGTHPGKGRSALAAQAR
ncbi:hypothetical protein [Thiocapsa sp.]|uniref:hypothetical protein n=1 Tax=Thiocapsa sp. TaxID=2024551 RepID=UPI0025D7CD39|nr:hypothetical protein [Thiocapsa sp.]